MSLTGRRLSALLLGLVLAGLALVAVRGLHLASFAASGTTPVGTTPVAMETAGAGLAAASLTPGPAAPGTSGAPGVSSTTVATVATVAPPPVPRAETASSNTSTGGARAVDVALVYAQWDAAGRRLEAAGYAAGLVEDGGVCTLSLSNGQSVVQQSGEASPDATTTSCGQLTVAAAQLPPGTWRVTLSYRSRSAQGTSAASTVVVPAA